MNKKPKLRWKRQPAETGLRRVGAAPRGYFYYDGTKTYARVSPSGGGFSQPLRGWCWTAGWDSDVPSKNTCATPCKTPEEAKDQAAACRICFKLNGIIMAMEFIFLTALTRKLSNETKTKIHHHDHREGLDMKQYTEKTIPEPGWYFWYPEHKMELPKFMRVDQDSLEEDWLCCRKYAGKYIGPIEIPEEQP